MTASSHLRIELQAGMVWRGEEAVHLTPNEQAVLGVLLEARGRVVRREDLNLLALGYHANSRSRALDATIRRLRTKLERDPARPVHLLSVYGKGYRLVLEARPEPTPMMTTRPGWLATRFVGRQAELEALESGLDATRAVALCGPSGVGKSRLAAEYLHRQPARYPGGRYWADISAAQTSEDALVVIATALGLAVRRESRDKLAAEVGRALDAADPLLLVVDGAERHLGELAPHLGRWRETPELHLVLTTRVHEGLRGWVAYTLQGLSDPDAHALLRDRADLALSLEPAEAERLVSHLDGLPLAIEFAASRLRIIGMKAMLRALERGTHATAESPTLVEAMTWALGTLSSAARRAVEHATAFLHPFDFEAFTAVCVDPDAPGGFGVLEELLNRCLVRRESREGEVLFSLYGAVRRQLGEPSEAARTRHAAWFSSLAATCPEVWTIDRDYMERVRHALGDWTAAWRWARSAARYDQAAQIALGLSPYLHHAGPFGLHLEILEGSRLAVDDPAVLGRLHLAEAAAHMANTDARRARASLVDAARCLGRGQTTWRGRLYHLIGKVEWHRKPGMEVWFRRAVETMAAAGDPSGAAMIQADLAQRSLSREVGASASPHDLQSTAELLRAEKLAARAGNPQADILVAWSRSYVHRAQGRIDAARATLTSVRDRFVALGSAANAYSVEMSLAYLAWWSTGDFAALARHLRAARRLAAGYLALRLDLIEAAAYFEDVLDERARPGMLRALSVATDAPELASDLLSIRIRLAVLDGIADRPLPTVEALGQLAAEATRLGDPMAASEAEVAISLIWARAGGIQEAVDTLEGRRPLDPGHPSTPVRERLAEALLMAFRAALAPPSRPLPRRLATTPDDPGRLTRIVELLDPGTAPSTAAELTDHAPLGVVLPHEVWLASQVATALPMGPSSVDRIFHQS